MTADIARSSRPPPLSLATACEPQGVLGARVLDDEALREHAAQLASRHGAGRAQRGASPVLARFAESRERIRAAYQRLDAQGAAADAVVAEEWLLDNRHVVE